MNQIWCKMFRPHTESTLWLQVPEAIVAECGECNTLEPALDYLGESIGWQFVAGKFFVVDSEDQLESLMETEV